MSQVIKSHYITFQSKQGFNTAVFSGADGATLTSAASFKTSEMCLAFRNPEAAPCVGEQDDFM